MVGLQRSKFSPRFFSSPSRPSQRWHTTAARAEDSKSLIRFHGYMKGECSRAARVLHDLRLSSFHECSQLHGNLYPIILYIPLSPCNQSSHPTTSPLCAISSIPSFFRSLSLLHSITILPYTLFSSPYGRYQARFKSL